MIVLEAIASAFSVAVLLYVIARLRARWSGKPVRAEPRKVILLYFDEYGAITPITEFGAHVDVFSVHAREGGRVYRHTLRAGRDEINAMLLGEEWHQPVTPIQRRGNLKVVK